MNSQQPHDPVALAARRRAASVRRTFTAFVDLHDVEVEVSLQDLDDADLEAELAARRGVSRAALLEEAHAETMLNELLDAWNYADSASRPRMLEEKLRQLVNQHLGRAML